jgi:hypothetical protein
MTFPSQPSIDLPRWATDSGAVKTEPSSAKRNLGWEYAGAGLQYGEAPPFPWVNWLNYSTGEWLNYCAAALTYIKNGNFDANVTVGGNVTIQNGNSCSFFNTGGSFSASFNAATLLSNAIYNLPSSLPTQTGSSLSSDTSGNLFWKEPVKRYTYFQTGIITISANSNLTFNNLNKSLYSNGNPMAGNGVFTAPETAVYKIEINIKPYVTSAPYTNGSIDCIFGNPSEPLKDEILWEGYYGSTGTSIVRNSISGVLYLNLNQNDILYFVTGSQLSYGNSTTRDNQLTISFSKDL